MSLTTLPVEIHRQAFRRSLKVKVRANGTIQVFCSKGLAQSEILKFLKDTRPFLQKTFRKIVKQRKDIPRPFDSKNPQVLWLGELYSVRTGPQNKLDSVHRTIHLKAAKNPWKNLRDFYKKMAEEQYSPRLSLWAQTMNLHPQKVVWRGQKSRWGSCSAQGVISLNWKMLIAPIEVIDYLMVHELSHLQHMNHGRDFWALVEKFFPDFQESEKWLRTHQHLAEFLEPDSDWVQEFAHSETIERLFLT